MTQFRRSVLVFNPASGKGEATRRAADFAAAFRERFGVELSLRSTKSLADIRAAAQQAAAEYDLQLFMGGDGTLSEALQGLFERSGFQPLDRAVGLLPAGSGNSFLRDFGLLTYPAARDALLDALAQGETVAADIAIVRYRRLGTAAPARKHDESVSSSGASVWSATSPRRPCGCDTWERSTTQWPPSARS